MNEKEQITIILIAIVLTSGFLIFRSKILNSNVSEFAGNVVSVGDNSLVVSGMFVNSNHNPLTGDVVDISFSVTKNTVIKRLAIEIPDTTEMVEIDSLPQTETVADIETVKKDKERATVGIFLKIKKSIWGKYTAEEINYRTPIFSKP